MKIGDQVSVSVTTSFSRIGTVIKVTKGKWSPIISVSFPDGEINAFLKMDCTLIKPKRPKAPKLSRSAKSQIMKDLGLTKVKGALGGTYWE